MEHFADLQSGRKMLTLPFPYTEGDNLIRLLQTRHVSVASGRVTFVQHDAQFAEPNADDFIEDRERVNNRDDDIA